MREPRVADMKQTEPSEAERLLRLACEHACGTPVAEQSPALADISLAIESNARRLEADLDEVIADLAAAERGHRATSQLRPSRHSGRHQGVTGRREDELSQSARYLFHVSREITLRPLGTRYAPPLDPRDESPVCDCPGECEGTCTGEEVCATPFEDWPEQEP